MWRWIGLVVVALAAGGVLFLLRHPVNSGMVRAGLIGCLGVLGTAGLVALWRWRKWSVGLAALLVIPVVLPGRAPDARRMRRDFVERVRAMEGTRYVWGGESLRGVDCSGLPRRSMRGALLAEGLRGNGRGWRGWVDDWWYDASARALGEGYRGRTAATGIEGVLRRLDPALLEPGDLAVTDGGVHVLVYLGDGEWAQADPGEGRVVVSHPAEDPNPWFENRVTMHRWVLLSGQEPG